MGGSDVSLLTSAATKIWNPRSYADKAVRAPAAAVEKALSSRLGFVFIGVHSWFELFES
jgi:hypothetical protein